MMYLLLRDNKQSGPYSLEELKTMGLKAYDLVWVEGKSAAWRYPCEVEELRSFAPVVEEQPFDRFYKKASSAKAGANSTTTTTSTSKPSDESSKTPSSSPLFTGEPSTVPGKRIIYVTMPAGNGQSNSASTREISRETTARSIAPAPDPKLTPASYKPEPVSISYEFEDNSSQLSMERTSVVEFPPRPGKPRTTRIVKPLAIGLSVLALLAAGVFIGLSINKDTLRFQSKIASQTASADNGQQAHTTAQQLPAPAVIKDPAASITVPVAAATASRSDSVPNIVGQGLPTEPPVSRPARVITKEKPANPNPKTRTRQALLASGTKDSSAGAGLQSGGGVPSILRGQSIVQKEAIHRTDPEEKTGNTDKETGIKANIASQVAVGANGYTVGTFGGITDLQVTVTNRSAYPLDLVVVEVQYIQANKKIYKTENLYFRGIGAGSALMQEAPKSSRGTRVQYKITMINSKELGLSYSGI
jgi:hypothetical protein